MISEVKQKNSPFCHVLDLKASTGSRSHADSISRRRCFFLKETESADRSGTLSHWTGSPGRPNGWE